jgi:putative endopeptidase
MIVGHELTHGFDDHGSQFDGDGNLSGWWPDAIRTAFEERTRCVAETYAGFEVLPGVKVNGELTLGENLADIGGLKNAFRAHRALRTTAERRVNAEGFTEDQLFFLAHGQGWCAKYTDEQATLLAATDPHSPSRFRVNGPLAQIPEFAETFQCAAGAKMRAENVCEVW